MKRNIVLLLTGMLASANMSAQQENTAAASTGNTLDLGRNVEYSLDEVTGAVNVSSSDKLSHKSTINVSNQLYGLSAGLQTLQNSGAAWEDGATLFVRGLGTLSSKTPLILVDGFERSLKELSSVEIESVTVLKDAVATSIYGMRGANGVILVKTKRGSISKPEFGFSYTFNMGTPNRLPKFANGYNYAKSLNEAMINDGNAPRYSVDELQAFKEQNNPYFYPNVDWIDETLRDKTFGDEINFHAKGGSDQVRYYTMLNFQDSRGLLDHTSDNDGYSTQHKYSKLNIRTNLDIKFSETTNVKINFLGKFDEHNRPGTQTGDLFSALYQVPSGAFPIKTERNVWGGTDIYSNNPVALVSGRGYARSQRRALYADLNLTQRLDFITPGLVAGFKIAIDNSASYWDSNTKNFGYEQSMYDFTTGEKSYKTLRDEGNLSFSKSLGESLTHYFIEGFANYKRTWDKHALSAGLTYSLDKTHVKGQNKGRAFMDVVANAHYSYANKYLVDLTMGSTGSSVLPSSERWGIFPAVGLGWIISRENFMNADWIDFLKVRASYGISGRADYDLNLYKDIYGGGNSYNFGPNLAGVSGKRITQLGITGMTYEKANKFNFGVDFNAFKKLSMSVDAFYDHRTDILVDAKGAVSSVLGVEPAKANAGIVDNYGVETMIGWDDQISDFKYHLGGTFSFARNEIKEMNEELRPESYLYRTGNPLGQIFGYEVEGIYQNQEEIDNRGIVQKLGPVKPGDLKYKDQNGDNVIDAYDQIPLGYNTTCPEIYYSLDFGAEYKGIGIYAMFQGAGNYSVIRDTKSLYRPITGNNTISEYYLANRWHAIENPNGTLPRLTYEGSDNNNATNSLWVTDASFFKLRTLELYYNVPTKAISKIVPVGKFKLFARAHDLFCIDKLDLQDPEATGAVHPTMTQYSFGFNLTF